MYRRILALLLVFLSLFQYGHPRVLDENEKVEAVNIHNLLRRSVVPTASNMIELEYSDTIASVAAQYLDKCTFSHMYGPQGYGENGRLATDANVTRTVMNWFQERVYYDWDKPYGERCYVRRDEDNYLTSPSCGHYTMLATYSLTKVGCAINYCPTITIPGQESINDAYLTFCFYDKGPKDYPYTPGKPCTGCEDDSYQYCNDGLCVKKTSPQNVCKVVCKRCQAIPTWIPGYCGCECDVGDKNDCSGIDKYSSDPMDCSTCSSLGTPCLNGGTDMSPDRQSCQCQCQQGYSGRYCEVTPTISKDLENSATVKVFGEPWYFGFRFPVDINKFEKKWNVETREKIERDIDEYCKANECESVIDSNVKFAINMAKGYPILDERGTLILKIVGKKTGKYLNKEIIREVISKSAGKETMYLMGYVNI